MKQRYMAVVDDSPAEGSCLIPGRQPDALGIYESTSERAAARCAVEAVKRGAAFGAMRVWVEPHGSPCDGQHALHRFDLRVTPKGSTKR